MEKIVNLDNVDNFEFSKLSLLQPSALQGGSYFTKLRYVGEPLYFQSPKLFTRNGIVETNKTNYYTWISIINTFHNMDDNKQSIFFSLSSICTLKNFVFMPVNRFTHNSSLFKT